MANRAMANTHRIMETRSKSRKASEHEPLPGDRQGVCRVGDVHDSMRAADGRELMRRTSVTQRATAQLQPEQPNVEYVEASTSSATPTAGSSAHRREKTARRGRKDDRIKWTRDMNIEVIRIFYRVSRCHEIPLPGYRHHFFREYTNAHPEINITEQNLVDRKNVIIKNGYLTQTELENIRREVRDELPQNDPDEINGRPDDTTSAMTVEDGTENFQMILDNDNSISTEELEQNTEHQKFHSLLEYYRNTEPSNRPNVPILNNIRKASPTLQKVNEILGQYINDTHDLTEIHLAIYCAAVTVIELNGQKTYQHVLQKGNHKQKTPPWKMRLEKSIDELRAKVDLITEYLNNNRSKRVVMKVTGIARRAAINLTYPESAQLLLNLRDTLRQKFKAKGARLRRYNELTKRKQQNLDFHRNRKKFFRQLELGSESGNRENNLTVDVKEVSKFWSSLWMEPGRYQQDANWIKKIETKQTEIMPMETRRFTAEDIARVLKKKSNWKAPGPDKIQNFWLKQLVSTHGAIARCFSEALSDPEKIPIFLTEGNTYLLYKKGDSSKPENYRPVTCLSVLYKLFTAVVNEEIYKHCETNSILAEEQKGCVRGTLGCKQQLTIDSIILKQVQTEKRNLHACYIDYTKAYDSVPHDWLLKVLEIYKISPGIIKCLKAIMKTWRTNLHFENRKIASVNIRRGIFQGDSLSSMWFCLAINPLSALLQESKLGYKIKYDKKITHLLFMDDLKLYAGTMKQLQSLINTADIFSKDINMSFGIDKCAILNVRKRETVQLNQQFQGIEELEPDAMYKYLGIWQNSTIDHTQLKKNFTEKYRGRITKVLNTKLSGKNIITAINTWAVPVLTYSFGIIKWSDSDLNLLDRITRRLLTKFRCLHPNSSTDRLYLPRKVGGRGLLNIHRLCRKQEQNMKSKLMSSTDLIMQHINEIDLGHTPLNLSCNTTKSIPNTQDHLQSWKGKILHGKFPNHLEEQHIDKAASLHWLISGYLYPETEGFVMAIQDRVLRTKNYEKNVMKMNVIDKCRKCESYGESIEHIMAGCPALSANAYLGRHNQLAKLIHQELAVKHGLLDSSTPYYKYCPAPVLETKKHVMYWDRFVITDKTVDYNRPDILLIDKTNKIASIIDIAVPLTHNIRKTELEKIRKYEELAMQLKQIWRLEKVFIYALVISSEGVMSKTFKKNLRNLELPTKLQTVGQKAVLLQTCHIVRRFLQ